MKFLKCLAYTIIVTIPPLAGLAQNPKGAEIRKMEQMEANAILHRDTVAIEKLWSKDFVVNTPRNDISNRAAAILAFKNGLIHYSTFQREIEQVSVVDNIGIAMGLEIVKPAGNAPNVGKTVKRRYTNIWMQNDNTWTLIARQATVVSIE